MLREILFTASQTSRIGANLSFSLRSLLVALSSKRSSLVARNTGWPYLGFPRAAPLKWQTAFQMSSCYKYAYESVQFCFIAWSPNWVLVFQPVNSFGFLVCKFHYVVYNIFCHQERETFFYLIYSFLWWKHNLRKRCFDNIRRPNFLGNRGRGFPFKIILSNKNFTLSITLV